MAWDDLPPEQHESALKTKRWDEIPPSDHDLQNMGAKPYESGGRQMLRSALDLVPPAGGALGGIIGTGAASPGIGSVIGGGLGYAAGQNLSDVAKREFLGEGPKTLGDTFKSSGQGLITGAENEMGGQIVNKAVGSAVSSPMGQKVLGKIGSGLAKAGEAFTGVPEKETLAYAKNPSEINSLAEASKKSPLEMAAPEGAKANPYRAAESMRETWDSKTQAAKNDLNEKISGAIAKSDPSKTYDITPILDSLEKEKLKYKPGAEDAALSQIDDLIKKTKAFTPGEKVVPANPGETPQGIINAKGSVNGVEMPGPYVSQYGEKDPFANRYSDAVRKSLEGQYTANDVIAGKAGKTRGFQPNQSPGSFESSSVEQNHVNLEDLNKIKRMLQGEVDGAYRDTGEMFNPTSPRVGAAKSAGASAREALNSASPEIAEANSRLSKLHDVDNKIRGTILKEGSPEASIISAGNGTNSKNAADLHDLGLLINHDTIGDANKLGAMRSFSDPKYLPVDTTGKATLRTGLGAVGGGAAGAGLGLMVGGHAGAAIGGGVGAATGGLLTSPFMLKKAIDAGVLSKNAVSEMLTTPAGRQALGGIINSLGSSEKKQ